MNGREFGSAHKPADITFLGVTAGGDVVPCDGIRVATLNDSVGRAPLHVVALISQMARNTLTVRVTQEHPARADFSNSVELQLAMK